VAVLVGPALPRGVQSPLVLVRKASLVLLDMPTLMMRPRYAGDGVLLPARDVSVTYADGPTGRAFLAGDRDVPWIPDPFGRVSGSEVLLAEDFARTDLSSPESCAAWYLKHGALALEDFWPDEDWPMRAPQTGGRFFRDPHDVVLAIQRAVQWHLATIVRLSQAAAVFDAEWVHVLVESPRGAIEVTSLRKGDPLRFAPAAQPDRDLPGIWIPSAPWSEFERLAIRGRQADTGPRRLLANREGVLELRRRVLEPWLRAAGRSFPQLHYERSARETLALQTHHIWSSVLGPITMQLVEGLLRASEGRLGGATCRECGRPLLALDARRVAFCTDLERNRYDQRLHQRRKRGSAPTGAKRGPVG
jgi:hypothetical protein